MSWKNRLYSVLLRRLLAPYLDLSGVEELSYGKLVVTDVALKLPGVHQARVGRFSIQLALDEERDGLALVAHVELDGLVLEIDPKTLSSQPPKPEKPTTPPSRLSSYLDAAWQSLRIFVTCTNTQVKIVETDVVIQLQSLSYRDDDAHCLQLTRVSASIGSAKALLLEETAKLRVRPDSIDLQVMGKLNVLVDVAGLQVLLGVLGDVREAQSSRLDEEPAVEETPVVEPEQEEDDLHAMDAIMKQYQEARRLVEDNHYRGGILVASEDDDSVDAFFDANDQSLYQSSQKLRQSLMMEEKDQPRVHVRVHLNECRLKLSFRGVSRDAEYVLASFKGLEAHSTLAGSSTEHSVTLARIEVEDSRLEVDGPKIGDLLVVKETYEGGDDERPCCHIRYSSTSLSQRELRVDLGEVHGFYRPKTLRNLSAFASAMTPLVACSDRSDEREESICPPENVPLYVRLACPVASVSLPVSCSEEEIDLMFERCGYECQGSHGLEATLGVVLDEIAVTHTVAKLQENEVASSFRTRNILFYVESAHQGKGTRRVDLAGFLGRNESNPSSPVSVEVKKVSSDVAKESFPLVQSLSTFKAREDDEEGLLDPYDDADAVAWPDPQEGMVSTSARATWLVSVLVPEVVVDLSPYEMRCVATMVERQSIPKSGTSEKPHLASEITHTGDTQISTADRWVLDIQVVGASLGLSHIDKSKESANYCLWFRGTSLRTHSVFCGMEKQHIRFLLQNAYAFESTYASLAKDGSLDERGMLLRSRHLDCAENDFSPILHRSTLLVPISRSTPAVVVDVVCAEQDGVPHQKVFTTVYDLTYRVAYFSNLLSRVSSSIEQATFVEKVDDTTTKSVVGVHDDDIRSVVHLFISSADCAFDYTSDHRFTVPTRALLQLGSVQLSSTVVLPRGSSQSFVVSIGDVSMLLSRQRNSYAEENALLLAGLAQAYDHPASSELLRWEHGVRDMAMKSLLSVDSVDATICIDPSNEPPVQVRTRIGEVALFACKDSFRHLVSALGEIAAHATALDRAALESLRKLNEKAAVSSSEEEKVDHSASDLGALNELRAWSNLRPAAGTSTEEVNEYLLDGYDWTAIDADKQLEVGLSQDEEQRAQWYGLTEQVEEDQVVGISSGYLGSTSPRRRLNGPRIHTHHFRAALDQSLNSPPSPHTSASTRHTKTRIVVNKCSIKIRLFDGYDWPELCRSPVPYDRNVAFVISGDAPDETLPESTSSLPRDFDRKAAIMNDLLNGPGDGGTFRDTPLAEERGSRIQSQATIQRLSRRVGKYVQVSLSGLRVRLDSFAEGDENRLASYMSLNVDDFHVADSISRASPFKMVGEWFSDVHHPRESNNGLVSLKMATWHPAIRVTDEDVLVSDEADARIQILPLRCTIDQRAVKFLQAFFHHVDDKRLPYSEPGQYSVPPPVFRVFRSLPFKMKVDYIPETIDREALRDGALVELVNLSPIDDMVLSLSAVRIENELGFDSVLSLLVRAWIQEIVSTQLMKFVTNVRALEPITSVSGAAADMVVLPWDAFRNGDSVKKALRSGARSLVDTVTYELLTTTSKLTEVFAAVSQSQSGVPVGGLPSRPIGVPRNVADTAQHGLESLARGLQQANYKVVIVPYREYHRNGVTGAMTSVAKGIPVAIAAPVSGAAEAVSYALLGARNQLRPDIRMEEEVSQRGLHSNTR